MAGLSKRTEHLQLSGIQKKTSKLSEIGLLALQRDANVSLAVLPNDAAAKRKCSSVMLGVSVPTAPIFYRTLNLKWLQYLTQK